MIFLAIILLTCAVNLGCSVTVELYSGQNYSGLLKKVTVNPNEEGECIKFDQIYEVRSLKTDKCVIVYETEECKHIGANATPDSAVYSVRVEKDTNIFITDGAYPYRKEERGVKSFHVCSSELGGGPKLNVDIYGDTSYTGDLVASFRDVCACTNIPSNIVLKGKYFSIDNHGNNMYFYDKADCGGQQRLIPAGDNERSRSVFHLDVHAVVIRSFRPADGLSCLSLDASVYKFTFVNGLDTSGVTVNEIKLGKQTVNNPTPGTNLKVDYPAKLTVTAEYSVAKAFTYIHTTRVKAGFLMDSRDSITPKGGNTLQRNIEANYKSTDTNQNPATIFSMSYEENMDTYTLSCTSVTRWFYVKRNLGFPVSYTAEAIVTGVAGGDDKVSAEQIRHFLPPGMKYVKDDDDYSVVVTVEGEMKGSYDSLDYSREISDFPCSS